MNETRNEILKIFEDAIDKANKILVIAPKRNELLRYSLEKEEEFEAIKKRYQKALKYLKMCKKNTPEKEFLDFNLAYKNAITKKLNDSKKEYLPYLEKFQEAMKLENEIEKYKDYIYNLATIFKNIKLEKNEILNYNLYSITVVILIANEQDYHITDSNFFASTKDFYQMIEKSNDKKLKKILEDKEFYSMYNIYDFLERI